MSTLTGLLNKGGFSSSREPTFHLSRTNPLTGGPDKTYCKPPFLSSTLFSNRPKQREVMDPTSVIGIISGLIQTTILFETRSKCFEHSCQTLATCMKQIQHFLCDISEHEIFLDKVALSWFSVLEDALVDAKQFLDCLCTDTSIFYAVLRCSRYTIRFQEISERICSCLRNLPEESFHLSEEAKQQLNKCLAGFEAAEYIVDKKMEQLAEDIMVAVKQSDSGVRLDHNSLTALTQGLGLSSNYEILRQASILEKQKDLAGCWKNKVEEDFINQVINLVTQISDDLIEHKQEIDGISIPINFRCPLSTELMVDPVIVASGQTYERVYIQKWLDEGNPTCPKTRQVLIHTTLISNYIVKSMIAYWCHSFKVPLPNPTKLALVEGDSVPIFPLAQEKLKPNNKNSSYLLTLSPEETNRIASGFENFNLGLSWEDGNRVLNLLQGNSSTSSSGDISGELDGLIYTSSHGKNRYHHEVRSSESDSVLFSRTSSTGSDLNVTKSTPTGSDLTEGDGNDNRIKVEQLVDDLWSNSLAIQRNAATELRFLAKHSTDNRILIRHCGGINPLVGLLCSSDSITQVNAVTALLNLSIDENNKHEIASAGAIDSLIEVLKVGSTEARENAAATLFSLSLNDGNKILIGQSNAIAPLVGLVINGTMKGKKDATKALFNLSILKENKAIIVKAGAVRPLVQLMTEPAAGLVDKAVAVLANLATSSEGRHSIAKEGGIPAFVEVVEMGSQRGKENAASTLLHLCSNSSRLSKMVLQEGAIPPLVTLSKSGTNRAKEKACALLHLFKEQQRRRRRPSANDFMDRHP